MGYTEYGDPQGKPIFHSHGWVSSRLEFGHNHDIAKTLGARVISVDRPGVGLSDFQPGRRILDWPDDITQLADTLGIDRFAVSGWSFGGPYAAVCAYKISHRLTAVGLIAAIAPLNRPGAMQGMMRPGRLILGLGKKAPWILRPIAWRIGRMVRSSPQGFVEKMSASLPAADLEVYSRLGIGTGLAESVEEMFRTGNRGAYWDGVAFLRPWGFRVEDIRMKVSLWQGDADLSVPLQMGEYYASAIPDCAATFYANEGHLVFFSHAEEIIGALIL